MAAQGFRCYAACDIIQIPPTNNKRGPEGEKNPNQAKRELDKKLEQSMQGI
jgi:hypothetical protein